MFTVIFIPTFEKPPYFQGEKNPFATLLEERRTPHQPGAGSALSGSSFSFICCTLPSALIEPVINSALYPSLMLFHSHFVQVVSLLWQKASHFACASGGCCFRSMARTAAACRNVQSTIHILPPGRGWLSPHCIEGPRVHQRGGTGPVWCGDEGQHSTLNPDQKNQTMA